MGDVRPLLMVHGWAGSFEHTWGRSGVVELLSENGRHVIPYDLPGHGTATKSHDPDDYRHLPQRFLRDVAGHAASSVDGSLDAVGFSLGAIVLLHALAMSPRTFGTVVLAGIGDGVFHPHDPARAERILSGLEGRSEAGDVVARVFGKIGNEPHNDPKALAAVLRRPREDPISPEALAAISNPVVIALGEKDFSAPATRLAETLPNATSVSLKNLDHFRTPESFDFIDLLVRTFKSA